MNMKCGIDIIEVNRIKESIEKQGEKFLNRVFTEGEIKYCESKKVQKYQSYAARFAGKEAVFKALSTLIDNKYEICWKDIEILNDESGRPFVNIYGKLKVYVGNDIVIEISLSHIKETAIAQVIAQF